MKVKVVWANGKLTDTPHIVGFEPLIKHLENLYLIL